MSNINFQIPKNQVGKVQIKKRKTWWALRQNERGQQVGLALPTSFGANARIAQAGHDDAGPACGKRRIKLLHLAA
jgi:hypothetical protein